MKKKLTKHSHIKYHGRALCGINNGERTFTLKAKIRWATDEEPATCKNCQRSAKK